MDLCRLVSEAGFEAVSLAIGVEAARMDGLANPAVLEEYIESGAKYGVRFTGTALTALDHYSYTKPESSVEEETAHMLIKLAIDTTVKLGGHGYLFPAFHKSAITDVESFNNGVRVLREYCELAAESGVATLFESPLPADMVIAVIEAVDHPMFRVYYDSQNNYLVDETDMAAHFKALADWVGEVHVKDGVGKTLSGAPLGSGSAGFYKTAEAIMRSNYQGTVLLENYFFRPPLSGQGDYLSLIKADLDTMRRVFHD